MKSRMRKEADVPIKQMNVRIYEGITFKNV